MQIALWNSGFIFFGYIPRSLLLDHMLALFLIYWGIAILFSIVAIRMWIPCNNVQGVPFLHILTRTFYLLSLIIAILTKVRWFSLWFGFVFPWWLVTLSMFSRSCWPFVYIFSLGKKCHSGCSLLIFQYDCCFTFFFAIIWVP